MPVSLLIIYMLRQRKTIAEFDELAFKQVRPFMNFNIMTLS